MKATVAVRVVRKTQQSRIYHIELDFTEKEARTFRHLAVCEKNCSISDEERSKFRSLLVVSLFRKFPL
jgi:hypothetical protein